MTMTLSLMLVCALAQVPNPVPAINAARDAKAKTEAAQQKNAEALDPQARAAVPAPAQAAPAQGAQPAPAAPAAGQTAPPAPPPPPPPQGAGYTYDPAGRRDPFVSLNARGSDVPPVAGQRPAGIAGLLVNEVNVKGVLKSGKGSFIALVQAPDNRTYIVKAGDKVFDGTIKAILQDAVVFSQDVNDPLSLVKQREVRKAIRPEER
jgi:Tfp pilus assembly protein PilP